MNQNSQFYTRMQLSTTGSAMRRWIGEYLTNQFQATGHHSYFAALCLVKDVDMAAGGMQ